MAIQKNDYAFLIGIWDYPDFRSLKGPKKDIKDFSNWLIDKEKGGGLPEANIETITSTAIPAAPIHSQIDVALQNLYRKVSSSDEDGRRLYFYFSGHGFGIKDMDVALALANWKLFGLRNSALKSKAYLDEFVNWGKFKEVIFFLDCCRSPLQISALPPTVGYGVSEDAPNVGKFIAHSTRHYNAAYEALFSSDNIDIEEEYEEEYNGIFTKVLLDGLWGGASSGIGVKASELKNYLDRHVKLVSNNKLKPQKAEVWNLLNDDIVFGLSEQVAKVNITFNSERINLIQLLSPGLDVIIEEHVNSYMWNELELTRGAYTLIDLDTQEEKTYRIRPSNTIQTINF
ncbi:caspase family protein [Tenacibaculum halocynthiae]|uniref:caspase family protein n=1 Tax=Tenacibaculum halocynthiae TaxID=1254437 RepID=UPI003894671F